MKESKSPVLATRLKYVRISPSKVRRILVQLKGKSPEEAIIILKFLSYKASPIISKLLYLAINNSREYFEPNSSLTITEIRVDSGPIMKRFCPHAKGRGFPIKKQTSHITSTT